MEKKISKKELILETAKQVFAEKGFDGSRMEEIAERAGLKKSLIYYYFEGKNQLLQEILHSFFDEYEQLLKSKVDGSNSQKYRDFLDHNCDILRIILIESLKRNTKIPTIFQAVEILMNYEAEAKSGLESTQESSDHSRWVTEFFTSILPNICSVCYKDSWCNYFQVSSETFENDFAESMSATHGEYHKKVRIL